MDWSAHYKNVGVLNLDGLIGRPDEWQVLLSERLRQHVGSGHGKWPYPDEEKIFDFSEELVTITNLIALKRETISEETCFYFLSKLQRTWFKFCHLFARYEGYLTILTLEKSVAAGKDQSHP
jgi:hypothetical protein